MKCVIAFSCLLAVASAGYLHSPIAYGAYDDGSYKGELYNGVLGGVRGLTVSNPGTPAVAYNAPLVSAPHPIRAYAAPIALGYAHAAPLLTEARLVDPVAIAAGAPLPTGDTVEVAAAKAAHAQAHAAAKGLTIGAPIIHGYSGIAPIAHGYAHGIAPIAHAGLVSEARLIDPVAIAAGAPLPTGDTIEVAAAKAAHAQAHAAAKGLAYGAPLGLGLVSEARLVDPVAIAAGAPLPTGDTVEVAAAKAFHAQAHHAAKAGHLLAKGHIIAKRSPVYLRSPIIAAPLAYHAPIRSYGYSAISSPLAYTGYGGHLGGLYL